MTDFHGRSGSFLRAVSKAAAWMMKRNVGEEHWWRWQVLTAENPDPLKRPVFDDQTAQKIFEELIGRNLLVRFDREVDGSNLPSYVMRYDIEGWDKAVGEGRPIYGAWLKFRRNWLLILLAFILGCLLTSLENRTVGLLDQGIDGIAKLGKRDKHIGRKDAGDP